MAMRCFWPGKCQGCYGSARRSCSGRERETWEAWSKNASFLDGCAVVAQLSGTRCQLMKFEPCRLTIAFCIQRSHYPVYMSQASGELPPTSANEGVVLFLGCRITLCSVQQEAC